MQSPWIAACRFAPGSASALQREDASDDPSGFAIATRFIRQFVWSFAILALAGCGGAQVDWSPDGTKAAYTNDKHAILIDVGGKVIAPLGDDIHATAWSTDSKSLYVAAAGDGGQKPQLLPKYHNEWLPQGTEDPTVIPAKTEPGSLWTISLFADGTRTPLFSLPADMVQAMRVSPDASWLALLVSEGNNKRTQLFVYDLHGNDLYQISAACATAFCFTGPNRLAYVEPDAPGMNIEHQTGQLVEVSLVAMAEQIERKPLFEALPGQMAWAQSAGGDILFTAKPHVFPGPIASNAGDAFRLYRFTRANGSVDAVAEVVGPLFAPSPDCKHILYEKITLGSTNVAAKRELAVMNCNGSDSHSLRDVTVFDGAAPLWPAWRGNDQITFVSPTDPKAVADAEGKVSLDVSQYHVTDTGELEFLKTLSDGWKELRPTFKVPSDGK